MLSYTAANAFPVKLLKNRGWFDGKIKPTHLQLNPTAKCNLNCSFCSCADRDKDLELPFEKIVKELDIFKELGGQSITITGGGEPLMHPDIERIIDYLSDLGIKIGLVTNGILLHKISSLSKLTWCRISLSNGFSKKWLELFKIPIDWAFSYVVTDGADLDKVQEAIDIVNSNNMTHIRIVSDILSPKPISKFKNDHKVVYQDRTDYASGSNNCWIALLKPYLDTDGYYYPCCGVQYAHIGSQKKMIQEMRMGNDLKEIIKRQVPFDGSQCERCYYDEYNKLIGIYIKEYKHIEFI